MLVVLVATTAVSGCSSADSGRPDGARTAVDALTRLGVDCSDPVVSDPAGLPYTGIACAGVQVDWLDDPEGYRVLVREDCGATPPRDEAAGGAAPDPSVLVVGPTFVVRGTDPASVGGWPRGVEPQEIADAMGGRAMTAAEHCREADSTS